MIPRPDNLDAAHVARVTALLDAFVAVGDGSLMLHETRLDHLPYIVWSWAQARGIKISTCPMVRADGSAYETWDIFSERGKIHIFPNEMGLLAVRADKVKAAVAEIQREAAARVKELLGGAS